MTVCNVYSGKVSHVLSGVPAIQVLTVKSAELHSSKKSANEHLMKCFQSQFVSVLVEACGSAGRYFPEGPATGITVFQYLVPVEKLHH